jgi:hypothetical protein
MARWEREEGIRDIEDRVEDREKGYSLDRMIAVDDWYRAEGDRAEAGAAAAIGEVVDVPIGVVAHTLEGARGVDGTSFKDEDVLSMYSQSLSRMRDEKREKKR